MAKVQKEITIKHPQGLHARPAALFVQIASRFDANIIVKKDNEEVNGKSIMGILMLAAQNKSKVILQAEGIDAEKALTELEKFLLQEKVDGL